MGWEVSDAQGQVLQRPDTAAMQVAGLFMQVIAGGSAGRLCFPLTLISLEAAATLG